MLHVFFELQIREVLKDLLHSCLGNRVFRHFETALEAFNEAKHGSDGFVKTVDTHSDVVSVLLNHINILEHLAELLHSQVQIGLVVRNPNLIVFVRSLSGG